MNAITFAACVDEMQDLLSKNAGALGDAARSANRILRENTMPVTGAFGGSAAGAALTGYAAMKHNEAASPEDQQSVGGRALLGGLVGGTLGGLGGHIGSAALDKAKDFTQALAHDVGYSASSGITRGVTDDIAAKLPQVVHDTSTELGAAPASAFHGFLGRLASGGKREVASAPAPTVIPGIQQAQGPAASQANPEHVRAISDWLVNKLRVSKG